MNLSGFRKTDETPKPPGKINLKPDAFAIDWSDRPTEEVCVGLRLLSEKDVTFARGEAANRAVALNVADAETVTEAYNDALMQMVAARAMCDVNDATQPYLELAEDSIAERMVPEAIKAVFDEVERLRIELSPTQAQATDEEIAQIPDASKALAAMRPVAAARVRRLLGFCLQEMLAGAEK